MAKNFANTVSNRRTAQHHKATPTQVKNNAGGYVFKIDPMMRIRRFLILGSTSNSYYVDAGSQIRESIEAINASFAMDGIAVVNEIVNISQEGCATSNDPAIFALACAASYKINDDDMEASSLRSYALSKLNKVCRIGTHLFTFLTYIKEMRGFGRSLRRAIANWYNEMPADRLALQVCKYQSRRVEGGTPWTHLDALRLGHPKSKDIWHNDIYRYVTKNETLVFPNEETPIDYIYWHEYAKNAENIKDVLKAIENGVSRESIPTEYLSYVEVWEAMLEKGMPLNAMIRNLGKMTSINVLKPLSNSTKIVMEALNNEDKLRKARIHPLNVLAAYMTYDSGHGFRGKLNWEPVANIVGALNEAFYKSFKFVEPTGKNFFVGIDVSPSMYGCNPAGLECMTCGDAAAAYAMTIARTEQNYQLSAFSGGNGFGRKEITSLNITDQDSLQSVINECRSANWGGTNCALPMIYATENKLDVDAFVVITDNETWCDSGKGHPFQVLQNYRRVMNKPRAKLIVVGMENNDFSIANENDNFSIDVIGFDVNTPNIISNFVSEKF